MRLYVSTLLEILETIKEALERLNEYAEVSTLLEILDTDYIADTPTLVSTLLEILGLVYLVVVGF